MLTVSPKAKIDAGVKLPLQSNPQVKALFWVPMSSDKNSHFATSSDITPN